MKKKLPGPVHKIPADFKKAVEATAALKSAWQNLTPLARNEWICWVTSAKKEETRSKRITRAQEDLNKGKRRPCCWPGCPHRRPSAKKWFK
ncbi:MAG: YdeI/OmpD-associated family protein [Bdellovibrionota bacterium]